MKRSYEPVPKSGPRPPAKRRPLPRVSHKRLSEREQRAVVRRLTIERAGHRCQGPAYGLPGRVFQTEHGELETAS